jgi:hypothetical protein
MPRGGAATDCHQVLGKRCHITDSVSQASACVKYDLPSSVGSMQHLPLDVLVLVFSHLGLSERVRAVRTCPTWMLLVTATGTTVFLQLFSPLALHIHDTGDDLKTAHAFESTFALALEQFRGSASPLDIAAFDEASSAKRLKSFDDSVLHRGVNWPSPIVPAVRSSGRKVVRRRHNREVICNNQQPQQCYQLCVSDEIRSGSGPCGEPMLGHGGGVVACYNSCLIRGVNVGGALVIHSGHTVLINTRIVLDDPEMRCGIYVKPGARLTIIDSTVRLASGRRHRDPQASNGDDHVRCPRMAIHAGRGCKVVCINTTFNAEQQQGIVGYGCASVLVQHCRFEQCAMGAISVQGCGFEESVVEVTHSQFVDCHSAIFVHQGKLVMRGNEFVMRDVDNGKLCGSDLTTNAALVENARIRLLSSKRLRTRRNRVDKAYELWTVCAK